MASEYLDTINVGGIDYKIQDATARETADSASTNAKNAVKGLNGKLSIADGVLDNIFLVDTTSAQADINQPHLYINTVTSGLPSGAILGVRNVYYYDANNICIELIDIRAKKVFRCYYWGPSSGWQEWTEGSGGGTTFTIKQFAYTNEDGYVELNNVKVGAFIISAGSAHTGSSGYTVLDAAVVPGDNDLWQILLCKATASTVTAQLHTGYLIELK